MGDLCRQTKFIFGILLLLTSFSEASRPSTKDRHGNRITQYIEQVFRHHSYELSIRPSHDGMPTRVKVSLMIESLTDISEKNMDFTCTLCLHETWKDQRLRFRGTTANQSVVLPSRLVDKLWVPDLYIFGSKSSFIHKTTVDNLVMRLYSDGTIFYTVKITSTVACQMNLHNFPLDVEKCSLRFQSLGYTSDELTLEWSVGNHMEDLFMDTRLVKNMPKFQLVHYTFHSTQYNYHDRDKIGRVSGMKSQLKVSFELKRYLLSVFFQSYFPALIMVVLAGLGMWIDPRSVPARISLGVTSVLTISTVITGLKTSLPKVSYLTAMDVYLWTCFIFVFSTVLEFCVVNYLMTEKGKKFLEKVQSRKEIRSRNRQIRKADSKRRTEANSWRSITVIKSRQPDNELDLYTDHNPTPLQSYKNSAQPEKLHTQFIQKKLETDRTLVTHTTQQQNNHPQSYIRDSRDYFCTERLCFPTSASMDVKFRIGYFLTFILFNGVYWTYYVLATKHADESED